MKERETISRTIGEIVAEDFRAAAIFKEAGIDFCCGGNMTLGEACEQKGVELSTLAEKLDNMGASRGAITHNYNAWQPAFLCDYIVNEHHTYLRKSLPELVFYTRKIARVHGDNHLELVEVADQFELINNELLQHIMKEEEKLFPAIKELFRSGRSKQSLRDEIRSLLDEHEFAGEAMDRINMLTNRYVLPSDACNSYRLAMEMLQEFEDDLHIHVHLENNILFPKTLDKLN